jgi:aminopeptidase
MIPRKTVSRCARSIVASMNLKLGESVIVQGGLHSQDLLEDIAYECYRAKALPMITSKSDGQSLRVMKKIPTSTLEQVPKHMLGAYEKMDCIIKIEPLEDPSVASLYPRQKIGALTKANVPLRAVLMGENTGRGKKWCYAGWPTPKAAEYFGVDYGLYERFIIEGMTFPISNLRRRCEKIEALLRGAKSVHVTDPEGTDFELDIKGRRINLDDGFVSDEDIAVNDLGNNLPAGEVFIAPRETRGSGSIFCPITKDKFTGRIIRDVELSFDRGVLDLDRIRASENRESVVRSFEQATEVDEKTRRTTRALNVAELGIGCNPKITDSIGYILTDEKVVGSVHVAFGNNYSYGGTSRSAMHWDFVTAPKISMVASLEDGGERTVMRNGRLAKSRG